MEKLLTKYNLLLRNEKRIIKEDCILRKRGSLLHVCLNSNGCRFGAAGSCTMCNYGKGYQLSEKKVHNILRKISDEIDETTESILIGTLGSIFDSEEVTLNILDTICRYLNDTKIKTIIFETHYTTINENVCVWLSSRLPNKDIVIELGLESSNLCVLDKCLNKHIDLNIFKSVVELLHSFSFSVTANVFLGAPFLNYYQQNQDTINTILWAINNNIDSITIFPANIRKNTLLEFLYKNNKYKKVSHLQILDVLNNIPITYLNRIFVSWYGDWMDYDDSGVLENTPPDTSGIYYNIWNEFYESFLAEYDCNKRKELIKSFYCNNECEYSLFDDISGFYNLEYNIECCYNWLKNHNLNIN